MLSEKSNLDYLSKKNNPSGNFDEVKAQDIDAGNYDYIIVGAGSAGCVVTRRIIDGTEAKVLLLEAGGDNAGIASLVNTLQWPVNKGSAYDYAYHYEPTPFANNKIVPLPRGKVIGGSGSINVMVWARGNKYDYDKWAAAGNKGWDYQSVLPLFKKIEDWEDGETDFHGAGGPIRIERAPEHRVGDAMIASAMSYGMPFIDDVNAPSPEGVGRGIMNIKNGERHGPATGYLEPVLQSDRLTVLTNAKVLKLNLEGSICVGLSFIQNGKTYTVTASKEVILSAGAIDSPRILMLSGIGDQQDLQNVGIETLINLPGVGKNLQDHLILEGLVFEANEPLTPYSGNYLGNTVYWKSNPELQAADLMVFACQVPVATPQIAAKFAPFPENAFSLLPALVNIKSHGGYLKLKNAAYDGPLEIEGKLASHPDDIEALVNAVKLCMDLAEQPAFKGFIKNWIAPARHLTDREEILDFIKDALDSYIHPVGTCKMGSDPEAVVNDQLLVHGLKGLRVVDASVMPVVPSCNTQAPTFMIAEFAANLILAQESELTIAS
jgi:choline dehydrogenase